MTDIVSHSAPTYSIIEYQTILELSRLRASGSAQSVYGLLRARSNNRTGSWWISVQQMASELVLSNRTVRRALQWLCKHGFVERRRRARINGGAIIETPQGGWQCENAYSALPQRKVDQPPKPLTGPPDQPPKPLTEPPQLTKPPQLAKPLPPVKQDHSLSEPDLPIGSTDVLSELSTGEIGVTEVSFQGVTEVSPHQQEENTQELPPLSPPKRGDRDIHQTLPSIDWSAVDTLLPWLWEASQSEPGWLWRCRSPDPKLIHVARAILAAERDQAGRYQGSLRRTWLVRALQAIWRLCNHLPEANIEPDELPR